MPETLMAPNQVGDLFEQAEVVLIGQDVFTEYLEHATGQYLKGRESVHTPGPLHRPNSFGLLGGVLEDDAIVVRRFAFAGNVRAVDPAPLEEFRETIVPRFGKQYDDAERGFWCDSRDVLRVMREFAADDLELLGSVHLHPDWHRIGPPHERGTQNLSENPSPMDQYLFRNAGWPLNIICYLETRGDGVTHTYACWRPPRGDDPDARVEPMTMRFF